MAAYLLCVIFWSIGYLKCVIIGHLLVFNPVSYIVQLLIFDVAGKLVPNTVIYVDWRSSTLCSSLLKILITVVWLGKLFENEQPEKPNSACK